MNTEMHTKGFTLVEMVIVVVIIGIISAIAWPQYKVAVLRARMVELQILTEQLNDAVKMYFNEHGKWADLTFDDLKDFNLPGWTIKNETDRKEIQKKDPNGNILAILSLWSLGGGSGQAVWGKLCEGKSKTGCKGINTYLVYTRYWMRGARECRAHVKEREKFDRWNVKNRVCDGMGGYYCGYSSSNGNHFIITTPISGQTASNPVAAGADPQTLCRNFSGLYNEANVSNYYRSKKYAQ